MNTESKTQGEPIGAEPEWIAILRSKVQGLRFGVVQLVVHDGRVTQIERTEKTRLPSGPEDRPRAG
jgi:hypothetical protein